MPVFAEGSRRIRTVVPTVRFRGARYADAPIGDEVRGIGASACFDRVAETAAITSWKTEFQGENDNRPDGDYSRS